MAENPFGWRSLAFRFDPGSDAATVRVDDAVDLMIGLDNRYRATAVPGGGTIVLRGRWDAGPEPTTGTFIIETLTLGELPQLEVRLSILGGQDLTGSVEEKIFGTQTALHGSAGEPQ